jgi:hypothetical protein
MKFFHILTYSAFLFIIYIIYNMCIMNLKNNYDTINTCNENSIINHYISNKQKAEIHLGYMSGNITNDFIINRKENLDRYVLYQKKINTHRKLTNDYSSGDTFIFRYTIKTQKNTEDDIYYFPPWFYMDIIRFPYKYTN